MNITATSSKGLIEPALLPTDTGTVLKCQTLGSDHEGKSLYDEVSVHYTITGTERVETLTIPVVIAP